MTAFDKLRAFGQTLVAPRRPEPSYPVLPAADEQGQSSVGGVYLVGEVAGTPLIKLGLNAGHDMVDRLAPSLWMTEETHSGERRPRRARHVASLARGRRECPAAVWR